MIRFITLLTIAIGAQLTASATAAGGFDDPSSVAWKFRYNLTSSNYGSAWTTYKNAGYMPIDIEMDQNRGVKYSGVWQKNTDGRGWVSKRNRTSAQFTEHWTNYKRQGYRLIDQDTTLIGGNVRYSMIMVQNKEGLKWSSNRNMSNAAFTEKYNDLKGSYKPVDVDALEVNGVMRYSIIWLENKPKNGWYLHRNMSPSSYGAKYRQYRDAGYRVTDLDCYARGGNVNYAAIWEKNTAGRGWAARRNMTSKGLRNKWKEYNDRGMRLIDIEVCPAESGRGVRYAAVWRENDARHDWGGRSAAQKLLADFVKDNDAPGVSAAVISKGKVVFRSGAGWADAEKKIEAHSGTIYRTASVAKGITGALAFDMQDAGIINLNDRTDTIVSGLESQHRHTALDLLQNIGCVNDYGMPGNENSDQTQYATAQKVLTDKLDGLLASNDAIYSPCTAGNNYKYSTHGYTLAAAALEVKGGKKYSTLLKQRISDKLKLSTMRAETRTSPDSSGELAKLYKSKTNGYDPVTDSGFQNSSWKWGGGGVQSSAVDLAKFGNALLDNKLFPKSVRDQLWAGTSANSGYGAGWVVDGLADPKAVSKRGRQQASLAHIRIDIDDDIVVVAMTNGSYTSSEGDAINTMTSNMLALAKANP